MLSDQDIFHRYQQKRPQFAKQAEISLVGHSLFDMWDNQPNGTPNLAGKSTVNLGLSGVSTRQYLDVIVKPKLISSLGKMVFVFLGVNDIVKEPNYSPKQVLDWLNEIYQIFQQIAPHSNYYLLEATPVNQINTVNNSEIIQLNQYIKANCQPHWRYVETQSHFLDPVGNLDLAYCVDGLHFNHKGYQILQTILEQVILSEYK